MTTFDVIAFDADDTLWHTEYLYRDAQATFKEILAKYMPPDEIDEKLYQAEMRNLPHFGYGIKAFALTMIESALELTDGQIKSREIQTLLNLAKMMLASEVQLLDHVADTLPVLAAAHTLMVITKGDLVDQESKIARSGLAPYFRHVEIVSTKRAETYQAILTKYQIEPSRFLMVGNSLPSDILPVLAIGGHAIYIPHPLTWAHDIADPPPDDHPGYYQLQHFGQLPDVLKRFV
jgi:putative hydrolase of the HAD superfamily